MVAFAELVTVESGSTRVTAGVRAALSIRPRVHHVVVDPEADAAAEENDQQTRRHQYPPGQVLDPSVPRSRARDDVRSYVRATPSGRPCTRVPFR